jgi:hypothetical protein
MILKHVFMLKVNLTPAIVYVLKISTSSVIKNFPLRKKDTRIATHGG